MNVQMVETRFGNRVLPTLPIHNWLTFQVTKPLKTHYRVATCKEVDCENYRRGWKSALNVTLVEHQKVANWIRLHSGRAFTCAQEGPIVTFTFSAGQRCFAKHHVELGKPEIYVVRGGDWRGNPSGHVHRHSRVEHFVEQFANNQDKLQTIIQRG